MLSKIKPRPTKKISKPKYPGVCVVGLDVSLTSTGIVAFNPYGERIWHCVVKSDSKHDLELMRLMKIAAVAVSEIDAATQMYDTLKIYIEGFAFRSQKGKVMTRAELTGILKVELVKLEAVASVHVIAPRDIKKWIVGHGSAGKDAVAVAVYNRFGFRNSCDDVVDAFAVGAYGHSCLETGILVGECIFRR